MSEREEFIQAIRLSSSKFGKQKNPEELFSQDEFRAIYEKPLPYFPAAQDLFRSRTAGDDSKKIAGYSMQRLPVEQFCELAGDLMDGVERHTTDKSVLTAFVFAPLNWGTKPLLMRHDSPAAKALIARMIAAEYISDDRKTYLREKVTTGVAKAEYLDYLAVLGRTPPE